MFLGIFKRHVRWDSEWKQTLRVFRKVMDVGVRRQTGTASQPDKHTELNRSDVKLLKAGNQVPKKPQQRPRMPFKSVFQNDELVIVFIWK